eukprot:s5707_g2.t1
MTVDCSEDAYAASLWGGSIGGIVVGILVIVLIVLMSLPLCCGVLKQYGKASKTRGADLWLGGTVGRPTSCCGNSSTSMRSAAVMPCRESSAPACRQQPAVGTTRAS